MIALFIFYLYSNLEEFFHKLENITSHKKSHLIEPTMNS